MITTRQTSATTPPDVIRQALGNRYFWTRVWGTSPEVVDELSVDDDSFRAYDELTVDHRRVEHPDEDDEEFSVELFSIPIHLETGHTWDVELYDTGDDAGTIHWLTEPGVEGRVEIGVDDAHATLPAAPVAQALSIVRSAAAEPRNIPSGVHKVCVLLLHGVIGVTRDDPRSELRALFEEGWRATELFDDEEVRKLSVLGWRRPSTELEDDGDRPGTAALNRLLHALAAR